MTRRPGGLTREGQTDQHSACGERYLRWGCGVGQEGAVGAVQVVTRLSTRLFDMLLASLARFCCVQGITRQSSRSGVLNRQPSSDGASASRVGGPLSTGAWMDVNMQSWTWRRIHTSYILLVPTVIDRGKRYIVFTCLPQNEISAPLTHKGGAEPETRYALMEPLRSIPSHLTHLYTIS